MIDYDEFFLENGLRVIVHVDKSTPIVAFNLLYNVGAKHEQENKTGFAHLFEHLMFGGSVNIPQFDTPLQEVGGDNNAFTSNDLTNYYITLPKNSLEMAFWLESDRMLSLAFTEKSLEVQRQVVIEEFKQRYLNQPYGDAFLLLRPLAFLKHPYKWATIGKDIAHIENANMEDVKTFFHKFYKPNNAILSIAGDVKISDVKKLANKWFADISRGEELKIEYELEGRQVEARKQTVYRDVPLNAIYKAFHMVERNHPDFYATDLISDILSRGNSSRLYQRLVKELKYFNDIQAYTSGDLEAGLFIISGKLNPGIDMSQAEESINEELKRLMSVLVEADELQKVVNKVESTFEFSKLSVLNKAMSLAISALTDSPELVNQELGEYKKVTRQQIMRVSQELFQPTNCSTLYYLTLNSQEKQQ